MKTREKEFLKLVGQAVRDLRKEVTKKSLRMFSYENDIAPSTLSRLERGESREGMVLFKKIAESFGWSLSELFARIEEKLPPDFKIFDDEHY